MNPVTALLDQLQKLITEHASAAVLRDHVAMLRDENRIQEKRLNEMETENIELKKIITGCPRCRSLNWSVAEMIDHPQMPGMGMSLVTYCCPDCGLEQKKNLK